MTSVSKMKMEFQLHKNSILNLVKLFSHKNRLFAFINDYFLIESVEGDLLPQADIKTQH